MSVAYVSMDNAHTYTYIIMDTIGGPRLTCGQEREMVVSEDNIWQNVDKGHWNTKMTNPYLHIYILN